MADVTNYTIENASGANVRTDLNAVFAAIQSSNSKSSDLATSQCVAGMPFLNTTTNILKIRNSSNGAFTEIGNIDSANLGLLPKAGGTMTGTLLGCVFIAMISNGLIHWGIDPDLNKVVKGIIIFLAVVINSNVTFKSNSGGPKED